MKSFENYKRYNYFLNQFSKCLQNAIDSYKKEPMIHPVLTLYSLNARTSCFMLQALARIDLKISRHKKIAAVWLNEYKAIEDSLGKVDYWYVYLKQNKYWNLPAPMFNYVTQQLHLACGITEERLIKFGWLTKDANGTFQYSSIAYDRFKEMCKKVKWHKTNKEHQKLLKLFKDESIKIHKKLISNTLDINKLEEGIHELRRKLRWIAIYSIALRGKVAIAKHLPGEPLSEYVTAFSQANKYNYLPKKTSKTLQINFLPGAYYALSEVIQLLGDIKDSGLCTAEFLKIASWYKISTINLKKLLGKQFKSYNQVVYEARQVVEQHLIKNQVLVHMSEYFNSQL